MSDTPTHLRHTGNGRVFTYNEQLAKRSDMEPCPAPDDAPAKPAKPEPPAAPVEAAPAAPASDGSKWSDMNWQQLKKEVESRGGVYSSRGDAIAFLEAAE